jgi:hypothetical protein
VPFSNAAKELRMDLIWGRRSEEGQRDREHSLLLSRGIFIFNLENRIIEAYDACLQTVGCDRS